MANKHIEKIENDLFDESEIPENKIDMTNMKSAVDALLKGEKVVIPDFGYLEPKSMGGRRTVVFNRPGPHEAVLPQDEELSAFLYNCISDPLKAGKVVSLPELGIFRPVGKENGSNAILFILSSSLRKQLNGEEKTAVQKPQKEESVPDKIIPKEGGEHKEENTDYPGKPKEVKAEVAPKRPEVRTMAKTGDVIIPEDDEIVPRKRNHTGWILMFVAFAAILVIGFSVLFQNKKEEAEVPKTQVTQSINLPYLAEQNYGNSIFWVYIYEANQDKLFSPVNIPEGLELTIPDLSEYGVDATDSMEIKRALMKSEVILKQINNHN
jgi:nucleoid DNA-binding protein